MQVADCGADLRNKAMFCPDRLRPGGEAVELSALDIFHDQIRLAVFRWRHPEAAILGCDSAARIAAPLESVGAGLDRPFRGRRVSRPRARHFTVDTLGGIDAPHTAASQ